MNPHPKTNFNKDEVIEILVSQGPQADSRDAFNAIALKMGSTTSIQVGEYVQGLVREGSVHSAHILSDDWSSMKRPYVWKRGRLT